VWERAPRLAQKMCPESTALIIVHANLASPVMDPLISLVPSLPPLPPQASFKATLPTIWPERHSLWPHQVH